MEGNRAGLIARRAVGAALMAAALGAQVMLPAAAFAAEQGQITITAAEGNQVTFDGYRIFKADIDDAGKAQNIRWDTDAVKAAVEGVIRTHAGTWTAADEEADATHVAGQSKYAGTSAQDALEYLNANWGASSQTRIVGATDLPNLVADAVDALDATVQVAAGTAAAMDEGFYLFVTTPASLDGTSEHGTSPIFAAVNADVPVRIAEKTTTPTVNKEIREDSAVRGAVAATEDSFVADAAGTYYHDLDADAYTEDEPANYEKAGEDAVMYRLVPGTPAQEASDGFGVHADANRGQDIDYRLTGTVAANVATFDTYYYAFTDTLSAGLSMQTSSVAVTVDGHDVTEQVASGISFAEGVLTVEISDLKALVDGTDPIEIGADTMVVVTYKAHLDDDAVIGSEGNPNEVYITYSNNPNTTSKGRTETVDVKAYTYQLELLKVDKATSAPLSGAKITMQVSDQNSDAASRGKYVQADGSLADTAYEFTTGADGMFSVRGIDEGTDVLHEVTPPANYEAWDADITVTVTSAFNATTGAFETIAATMSGGEGDALTCVTAVDSATGKVSVRASDDKLLDLPLTGGAGVAAATLGGAVVAAISLAGFWRESASEDKQK